MGTKINRSEIFLAVEGIVDDWIDDFCGSDYAAYLAARLCADPRRRDECLRACWDCIAERVCAAFPARDECERARGVLANSREIAKKIEEGARAGIDEAIAGD